MKIITLTLFVLFAVTLISGHPRHHHFKDRLRKIGHAVATPVKAAMKAEIIKQVVPMVTTALT